AGVPSCPPTSYARAASSLGERRTACVQASIRPRGGGRIMAAHPTPPVSVARVVLERDPEPDPVLLDRAVLDHDILSDDLGDAQVAHRFRRGLDRAARGGLPRLAAHADHLG